MSSTSSIWIQRSIAPHLSNKRNESTFKHWNIPSWKRARPRWTDAVARLDRLNIGRVQRLRTEDLLLYHRDLNLKLAGIHDNKFVIDRVWVQSGLNLPRDSW